MLIILEKKDVANVDMVKVKDYEVIIGRKKSKQ